MYLFVVLCLIPLAWSIPVDRDPMINDGMFEGDMLGVELDEDRNAVPRDSQRWPGGIVPYYIAPDIAHLSAEILRAMRHIENKTCIRFVERQKEKDYVQFFKHVGCYSRWGRVGGMQYISLGDGCHPFGTIVHEILHALGFEHEHSRSDRDDYLIIHLENIETRWQYAFKKLRPEQHRLLTPFDYDSIMLYGSSAFTLGRPGRYSMTDKNGKYLRDVFKKPGLAQSDIKRINLLYECPQ